MSNNMKTFLESISKDWELTKKVNAMADKADIIAVAKELGIEITEADFETRDGEMSEDELNTVAGGGFCFCSVGGGGTAEGDDGVCACVGYGQGNVVDNPTGEAAKEFAGDVRCTCVMAGIGEEAFDLGTSDTGGSFIR